MGQKLKKGAEDPSDHLVVQKRSKNWLLYSGLLGLVFIVFAALNVWLHVQYVQDGYRLTQLQSEYEQLLGVRRKLRLEWSQLRNPSCLEELASEKFSLSMPRPDQKIVIRETNIGEQRDDDGQARQ